MITLQNACGTGRQFRAEEAARFRKNQVGLENLAAERWGIEIRESDTRLRVRDARQWLRHGVPGLVVPNRKMVHLDPADAEYDSQNFGIGYL